MMNILDMSFINSISVADQQNESDLLEIWRFDTHMIPFRTGSMPRQNYLNLISQPMYFNNKITIYLGLFFNTCIVCFAVSGSRAAVGEVPSRYPDTAERSGKEVPECH